MTEVKKEVAEIDKKYFQLLREDVSNFIKTSGEQYDEDGLILLDIAPQDHEGAKPYFPKATVETLDLSPDAGATYVADLCKDNSELIPSERFDVVVCTEVLEHTLQPFDAVDEIKRLLKPGGVALISTPYNFRIHGPLPDCWRFTEHGLRALFKDFEIISLDELEDEERFLAPIHYKLKASKRIDG
jgi:SAM-dependent methyltransferase